ncbi:MAG: ATP-dependent DNA helicase RecG [Elusimicrobia bacterium]|nr:ATP-dependent DNA helicase RecG [Elusimicrobiota bacterium]
MVISYFNKVNERLELATSVRYMKGVGPRMEEKLHRLGIRRIEDLVFSTPRVWEDRRLTARLPGATGGKAAFYIEIEKAREAMNAQRTFCFFRAWGRTTNPYLPEIALSWIRRRSHFDVFGKLRLEITPGAKLLVYGKLEIPHRTQALRSAVNRENLQPSVTLDVLEYELLSREGVMPASSAHWLRLVPVYPATEGLGQKKLRQLRWDALRVWRDADSKWKWPKTWSELLPAGLLEVAQAYEFIHFPKDESQFKKARLTLAFWDIFILSLAMEIRKRRLLAMAKTQRYKPEKTRPALQSLLKNFGLELTQDQHSTIDQIFNDMNKPTPMNRLVQGEVGSGKTLVAVAAICHAAANAHQAAFIAPTEVLVFQHAMNFERLLRPLGIKTAHLTSETQPKERQAILEALAAGGLDLILGTHALLDPDIQFRSLALTIIDEQHRFGVSQRWTLRTKGSRPDTLILSATPIPRTLALALYGDLDISSMRDLPGGRQIPKAEVVGNKEDAWKTADTFLKEGRQIYVVAAAIEESDALYSLEEETKELSKRFPRATIKTLHGRMPSKTKEAIFEEFQQGKIQILAATTVIEVGLDIPRAGLIVVLGAERFGLATLHQLRGRVGRDQRGGLCLLVPGKNDQAQTGSWPGPTEASLFAEQQSEGSEAIGRLRKFCECKNGFEVGELDLQTRGPGDLLGQEQHGMVHFRHFDWNLDQALINKAKTLAGYLVAEDAGLREFPELKKNIERSFGLDFMKSDLS